MLAQHVSSSAPFEDIELEADPESVTVNPEAQQSSSRAPLEDKELDADPVTVNLDVQQDTSSTPLEDRAGGRPKGSEYESRGTKGVLEHTPSRQGDGRKDETISLRRVHFSTKKGQKAQGHHINKI